MPEFPIPASREQSAGSPIKRGWHGYLHVVMESQKNRLTNPGEEDCVLALVLWESGAALLAMLRNGQQKSVRVKSRQCARRRR